MGCSAYKPLGRNDAVNIAADVRRLVRDDSTNLASLYQLSFVFGFCRAAVCGMPVRGKRLGASAGPTVPIQGVLGVTSRHSMLDSRPGLRGRPTNPLASRAVL